MVVIPLTSRKKRIKFW